MSAGRVERSASEFHPLAFLPKPPAQHPMTRRIGRALAIAAALMLCPGVAASTAASPPRITFYFGLKRPEGAARSAFFSVQEPRSRSYRRFLRVGQAAQRYGASQSTRTAFARLLRHRGLSVRFDRSGVFARVSGTVVQLEHVFGVRITRVFSNAPNVYIYSPAANGRLHLPAGLGHLVQDVVATYAHSAPANGGAARARAHLARRRPPKRTGTWTRGCRQAKATGAFSFGQVRRAYGIDQLGSGTGASVAILNLGEGVSAGDIAENARCFGYPKIRPRILRSDGQTGPFSQGTFEPEEDLAVVRGIAPGLRSLTFTQAWLTPQLWFLGVSNVLAAGRLPDSLSISYGECERDIRAKGSTPLSRAGANLMDAVLVRLGLTGVGVYASSGDFGSSCNGRPYQGTAWPGSSPYLTAVGGTQLTLARDNRRAREVVWNDLKFESINNGAGAAGGGYSAVSARPPFQRGLRLPGTTRMTPDVSAVASEFPGWPVVLAGHWATDAGTSGSAPLVAAAMAIVSAGQRHRHRPPVGPANGLFYYLAGRVPSTIWDVVRGNNGYLRNVRGHVARRGYDLASGVGALRFAALSARLPPPAR